MKAPGEAIICKPLQVLRRKDETIERMLKRFSRKVRNENVLKDHVDSKTFVKPSVKRRLKRRRTQYEARKVT